MEQWVSFAHSGNGRDQWQWLILLDEFRCPQTSLGLTDFFGVP